MDVVKDESPKIDQSDNISSYLQEILTLLEEIESIKKFKWESVLKEWEDI